MNRPDPNEGRNDPIDADGWKLGEDFQDALIAKGYQHPTVEGIAVDLHDLLQAADRVRDLAQQYIASGDVERLRDLRFELDHMAWHGEAGAKFLDAAIADLGE